MDDGAEIDDGIGVERLTELVDCGLFGTDGQGRFRYLNSAAERIFGLPRSEMLGHACGELPCRFTSLDGEPLEENRLPFARAAQTGQPVEAEVALVSADDSRRLLALRVFPVFAAGGGLTAMAGKVEDLSSQKSREEELERLVRAVEGQSRFFQDVLENAPAGIVVFDGRELRVEWANDVYRQFLEDPCREMDLIGMSLQEMFPQAEERGVAEIFRRVARTRKSHFDPEFEVPAPQGETTFWRWALIPLPCPKGEVPKLMLMLTDVTGPVRLRRRTEVEQARLRAILEAQPVGTMVVDRDGRLVEINRAAEHILGGELAVGEPVDFAAFAGWCSETLKKLEVEDWPLWRALHRGEASSGEMIDILRLDGECASLLVSAAPLPSAGAVGAVAAFQDVSERRRMERDLRESEEKFRALAENAAAVFGIVQGERFVYVNPYLERVSGYSRQELLSIPFGLLVHPEFRSLVKENARRRQISEEAPGHYEFKMVTKAGEERWMDFSPAVIDYRGRPAVIGVAYDITERKRAEEALRQSEERYRSLFENIDETLAVDELLCDPSGEPQDWRILDINPAFQRTFGLSRELAVGRCGTELFGGRESVAAYLPVYRQVVETGAPQRLEMHVPAVRKDFLVSAFALGERRFATIGLDITERKRAEAEREALLAEMEAIVHSIADAVIIFDSDGRILRLNPAAGELLGCPSCKPTESARRLAELPLQTTEGQPVPFEENLQRVLRGEKLQGMIVVCRRQHAENWYSLSAAPIATAAGFTGAVLSVTDITAIHQLQEQFEVFLHAVSHDLRAPLTVIMGYAQLLEGMCAQQDSGESLAAIIQAAEKMNRMIEDLVDFARLEGGQLALMSTPVSLQEFIPRLLLVSRTLMPVERVRLDLPAHLPPVSADSDRLERIVLNLLSNALKFSPDKSPVLVQARHQGEEVRISVIDQGEGIDPEDLPHIFERFYKVKGGRKAGGVGLGLYITRVLVESHGGRIAVRSRRDEGSRFSFTLPVEGEK